MKRVYLCIDLKTFFASVECVERNLDPFKVNLAVADKERGKGALCLAISPKLKALGIKNRCRLFEIPSYLDLIIAKPRMKLYMQYAANIYEIYLKYVCDDDIHVYSIDEVFLDISTYFKLYRKTPLQMARMIIDDIFETTGITATAGIGSNLYLSKVALDISAKHNPSNIGILNEPLYKQTLWHHQPITDFWHVGRGIAKRLAKYQIFDMAGVAFCDEKILYQEFGVNAKYLIDHAWGKEPTTIAQIKKYQPENNSISHSQVLFEDYSYEDALLAMKEMVELKVLDLVEQHLVTRHIALYVGYSNKKIKATGGSLKIGVCTNSYRILLSEFITLYKRTTHLNCPIRRLGISFGGVIDEKYEAYDLFTDYQEIEKERKLQEALINIKGRYGKNAVFKGMDLLEKATTLKRNKLIGGHNGE
ncbi:DNA repair protein [uncultured Thomasclavelia sp.]|uniref:Y-family DNA polymerase n=1 Tax=uncultured Thomasclavelia sp. TaxID=3025759 RepID=UPI0026263527|nr:DNA repair protein [uncultured Thomasclavelia sp.]